jgi:hypothetical protein
MSNYYGSIDLTKLGQIVKQHPELVKTVNMKDGTQHKFLNIDVNEKQQPDQYGNVAYLKASCKKAEQKQGLNYYLCDLKESQNSNQQQPARQNQAPQNNAGGDDTDLPF